MNSEKDIQLVEMINQIQVYLQLIFIRKELGKKLLEKTDFHSIERLRIIQQIIHINQLTELLFERAWNHPVWSGMTDEMF